MAGKNILIIEPDEIIASIIQKSFVGYDPNFVVTISSDPLIISDLIHSNCTEMILADADCLLDMPAVISLLNEPCNQSINLVVISYNNLPENYPLHLEDKYHFLHKPVDGRLLFSIIEKIFGPIRNKDLGHFSLSREQYSKCNEGLIKLRNNVGARCIMLSDPVGRVLLSTGTIDGISSDTITSLLGGGLATLLEAGKELDQDVILNLSYREGQKTDLYALNIGKLLILIIIIDKGRFYNKLGTVWYYARQTALSLESFVSQSNTTQNQPVFEDVNGDTISNEIDRLINF